LTDNVGIATTAPRVKLEVDGTIYGTNVGINSVTPTGLLDIKNNNASSLLQITNAEAGDYVAVTSDGNFGIGSTRPEYKLKVTGTGYFSSTLWGNSSIIGSNFAAANGGGNLANTAFQFSGDADTGMYAPAANIIGLVTGGVERIRIDTSGNVGIGTSYPRGLLEVDSGVYTTPFIVLSTGNVGIGSTIPQANLEVDGVLYTNGNIGVNSALPSAQINIKNNATTPFQISNAAAGDYVTVTSSGNMGIGKASPAYTLDVGGTGINAGSVYATYINGNYIAPGNSYNRGSITSGTLAAGGALPLVYRSVSVGYTGGYHAFELGGTERMRITDDGNTGIGSTVPHEKLEVNGAA
jgi:hypothetical protein